MIGEKGKTNVIGILGARGDYTVDVNAKFKDWRIPWSHRNKGSLGGKIAVSADFGFRPFQWLLSA